VYLSFCRASRVIVYVEESLVQQLYRLLQAIGLVWSFWDACFMRPYLWNGPFRCPEGLWSVI